MWFISDDFVNYFITKDDPFAGPVKWEGPMSEQAAKKLSSPELGPSPLEGIALFVAAWEDMERHIVSSAYGLPPGAIVGIDRAAPGSKDQTVYSPVPDKEEDHDHEA